MNRRAYKVEMLDSKVSGTVLAASEEELYYNLKGMAETVLMKDPDISSKYANSCVDIVFIHGTTGESWEDNFRHTINVFDKGSQKILKVYYFNVELLDESDKEVCVAEKEKEGCKETSCYTLNDYKNRQQRIFDNKVSHGFNITNVYQEARYILEEVAELMRAIEKEDKENIIEELADIVIFSYGCAAVAGVGDLDKKIFEKMSINESREYTVNSEGDFIKKE